MNRELDMTTTTMTTHERFERMYAHREADRVPWKESIWDSTIRRWHREGLPEHTSVIEHFDLDLVAGIGPDTSPRFETRTLDENDEYRTVTTAWGATMRQFKFENTTPEYLDFQVKTPDDWRAAKARMTPSRDRINWKHLEANYGAWRKSGAWISASGWFCFDIPHSHFIGTERLLMALVTDPEWVVDMWNHELTLNIALLDMIWDAGYRFDEFTWPDDMGYKHHQFFSLDMYRELLKPVHKRAIDWAHAKGVKTRLHSCGDIRPFIPELTGMGLDALNPIEVKAGMDPFEIKRTAGDALVLHGGINAEVWHETATVEKLIRERVPALMKNGGYIFASDHSVPSAVSFNDFTHIVSVFKEVGTYR